MGWESESDISLKLNCLDLFLISEYSKKTNKAFKQKAGFFAI